MSNLKGKDKYKINYQIAAFEIRIIGDNIPFQKTSGSIMNKRDAQIWAEDNSMDLILVNNNDKIPVCKIQDFTKFLYENNKRKKEEEKNRIKSDLKEIRLTPNISDNDLNTKINQSINFLKEGHKIKAIVFFKGREMAFKNNGERVILEFADRISEYSIAENMPKLEGKKMFMNFKKK